MKQSGHQSYRRRRLEPLSQRVRRALQRIAGGEAKTQRVYRVEIGELSLKQIVMPRAVIAERLALLLERFREARITPALVARYGSELWLEFLEGDPVAAEPAPVDELARIFATLYRETPRLVTRRERDFCAEIERDLEFLGGAGLLSDAQHAALRDRARKWCPEQAWVGHDYSDPRPANFLWTEARELRVIDVESLQDDALLGAGAVRAALRWPGLSREALFARLESQGAAPFLAYLDFVELWFVTGWTKRCILQRKQRLVDLELLSSLAERD